MAAARAAVEIARGLGARLRIVHVLVDHEFDAALLAATGTGREGGGRPAASAILRRVTAIAEGAGVDVEAAVLDGEVGQAILDDARHWAADVIVIGRARQSYSGEPYVGAQTRHVLEFAERPVLVVPPPRTHDGLGAGPRSSP
jgi:nucleotide-binding universal stress UspA family protein